MSNTVECSTFAVESGEAMANSKTATLTFRIDPSLKEALRVAAHAEHRSIANMIEVLIRGYCEQRGIAIPDSETENKSGERS
ncbi:ribbon-helix-helix protein, CopG family [Ottowia cancrivicina]|nr:ribbon-helix-helix protein, CopG family [Ottowia sp. 10c7w1]